MLSTEISPAAPAETFRSRVRRSTTELSLLPWDGSILEGGSKQRQPGYVSADGGAVFEVPPEKNNGATGAF